MAHSPLVNVEGLTDLSAVVAAASADASTRAVYAVVIALGVIGVALLVLALWLIRQTRPEPQLLAPLERMDDRSWRAQGPAEMRRDLNALRPEGARPVVRVHADDDVAVAEVTNADRNGGDHTPTGSDAEIDVGSTPLRSTD